MAGGLLAALGGIGQGYNTGADSALRRRLIQQQLREAMLKSEGGQALALALQNGIPGLGGPPGGMVNPQPPPMPGQASTPAPAPQAAAAPIPQPPVPQPPQRPMQLAQAPAPSPYQPRPGFSPYMGSAGSPDVGVPDQGQQLPSEADQGQVQRQIETDADAKAREMIEPPAATPPTTKGSPDVGPQGSAGPDGQQATVPVETHDGVQYPDISTFMQQVNPQQMMQAIMKARPGTRPEAALYAVEQGMKLAQYGTAQQKLQTAYMMKMLGYNISTERLNETIRHNQAGETAAGQRIQQGQQRVEQGNRRLDQGDTRLQQGAERIAERKREFDTRLAQAKTMGGSAQKIQALRAMLSDVDRNLNPGGITAAPTGDDRAELMRQRAEIVKELRTLGFGGSQ